MSPSLDLKHSGEIVHLPKLQSQYFSKVSQNVSMLGILLWLNDGAEGCSLRATLSEMSYESCLNGQTLIECSLVLVRCCWVSTQAIVYRQYAQSDWTLPRIFASLQSRCLRCPYHQVLFGPWKLLTPHQQVSRLRHLEVWGRLKLNVNESLWCLLCCQLCCLLLIAVCHLLVEWRYRSET